MPPSFTPQSCRIVNDQVFGHGSRLRHPPLSTRCTAFRSGFEGPCGTSGPRWRRGRGGCREGPCTGAGAGRACRWFPRLACAARAAGRGEGLRGRRVAGKGLVDGAVPVGAGTESGACRGTDGTPGPARVPGTDIVLRHGRRPARRRTVRNRRPTVSAAGAVHPALVAAGRPGGPAGLRAYARGRHPDRRASDELPMRVCPGGRTRPGTRTRGQNPSGRSGCCFTRR